MGDEKMSEFTYKSKFKEYGRIHYLCVCSVCGNDCVYAQKSRTKPVCIPCKRKRQNELAKKRRESEYERGRADEKARIISYLNDCRLIEDNKGCYECISELMEKIEKE